LSSDASVKDGVKSVMRVFPQGVTVVTTMTPEGPRGLTVSAFTSISLEPPLVLVSISKASRVHSYFMQSNHFAVNLLADDQKSVSQRFAGLDETADRFKGMNFAPGQTGSPVIQGVRAVVECRKWSVYDGGDHSIVIGEVVRAQKLNDKPPLVFYQQQYTTTEKQEAVPQPGEVMW
jgi:flavin reductase (DIM6/NTAB) family NADH-FMN oxidoreductase RutF